MKSSRSSRIEMSTSRLTNSATTPQPKETEAISTSTRTERCSATTANRRNLRWLTTGLVLALLSAFSLSAEAAVLAQWNFSPGAELLDSSGNGNNLSNTGVTFANQAAVFNGAQTIFSTTAALDLTGASGGAITVEWFMRSSQATLGILFEQTANKSFTEGAFGGFINTPSAGDVAASYNSDPGNFDLPAAFIDNGEFVHYAIVIDQSLAGGANTQVELFVDYVSVATTTVADVANFVNDTFFIGSRNNTSLQFIGELDDIRISDLALAPNQFLQSQNIVIPEPSTFLLLGAGLLGMGTRRRRRAK